MSDNKKIPKVLMVGPGRDVMGGISTVVNTYYDLGLDKKVNLHYITSMEDGGKLKKLTVACRAYFQFKKCIKQFDIVHIHMAAQASFTRKSLFVRSAKKAGKKVIIHQHSADFDVFYNEQCDLKKQAEIREIFSLADKLIVLSEEWAEFFGRNICDFEKIIVLYNGIILPENKKDDYTDHNVLFLGRLGKRKGSYDLLKAIPNILKDVPDAIFYFGGDGDIEQSQRIIDENHLSEHVKLLGWVRADEKEKYLNTCSVFILPSYHEGMPIAVLEAMSYGLATISTNAGGIPQIIENGVNGIRIEAGDVDAIRDTITKLLTDDELKKKLGVTGQLSIEKKFSAKSTVEQLVQIYYKTFKCKGEGYDCY